jgi:hypothetical protein
LTVIAHSWGAVVALDALLDLSRADGVERRKLTFVSVGAALNRVWSMRSRSSRSIVGTEPVDEFWRALMDAPGMKEWLGKFRWINMWSRYDPVPAGPLEPQLHDYLAPSGLNIIERRVVNLDDLLGDHTTYWTNTPEVVSRLVYEAIGHPLTIPPVIASWLARIESRRSVVGRLALFRLGAIALGVLCTAAAWQVGGLDSAWGQGLLLWESGVLVVMAVGALVSVVTRAFTSQAMFVFGTTIGLMLVAAGILAPILPGVAALVPSGLRTVAGLLPLMAWTQDAGRTTQAMIDIGLLIVTYKLVRYFWFGPRLEEAVNAVGAGAAVRVRRL